jgi:guanine nucleotide-binding protein subunit beta-2-like 1 protein
MAEETLEHTPETGTLKGHNGWVTSIVTATEDQHILLTGSRDKTIAVWRQVSEESGWELDRRLSGHSHFVSDLSLGKDCMYALSSAWDGSLRLWNLEKSATHQIFKGHTKAVLSVALSADNHCIVSGSMDKTIRVWNSVGKCITELSGPDGHDDWVTCVRFTPTMDDPVVVSCSRDKLVKVWDMNTWTLKHNLVGHTAHLNVVTVSPDGSLCASGGKDGVAMLWDLTDGKSLSTLDAEGEINALVFSPTRYWLCAAFGSKFRIWDLETKDVVGEHDIDKDRKKRTPMVTGEKKKTRWSTGLPTYCTSLAWSPDGTKLFAGYSNNSVYVYELTSEVA